MDSNINSKSYWDNRFEQDWSEASGREQTQYFCQLAMRHLPDWLGDAIRTGALTVCDWGCAEGDGTRVLTDALAPAEVVGIDFSDAAIHKATQNYPGLPFRAVNLLEQGVIAAKPFDVIFSSNTLEHFDQPFDVLEKLDPYIGQWLVVLVPYREFERIPEHEFTFDFGNTPVQLRNGMALVHAELMDTRQHHPCYWPGEQMLLIYGRPDAILAQGLTLGQVEVIAAGHFQRFQAANAQLKKATAERKLFSEQLDHAERARALAEFRSEEALRQSASAERRSAAAESRCNDAVTVLEQRDKDLALVYGSLSWRVTAPLRMIWSPFVKTRRSLGRLKRFIARQGGIVKTSRKLLEFYRREGADAVIATVRRKVGSNLHASPIVKADIVLPPAEPHGEGEDVIFWGVIDWHFRFQRPQQLALGFAARGHRVFYVSAQLLDRPEPGFSIESIGGQPGVYQVRFHALGAPPIYNELAPELIHEQIRSGLAAFVRWAGAEAYISVVQHPFWLGFAHSVPRSRMVYDCMDHHEGFGNVSVEMIVAEKSLMAESDVLVVTSDWLRNACEGKNANVFTVRNACDFKHFSTQPERVFQDPKKRRIIGYYGAIAEWFDVELVRKVALAFPDHLVMMIGADTCNASTQLADLPNIEFFGEIPYAELPHYLYAFDICVLPFRVIDLTLATNPVKVYEYLCSGKPVVSVSLPEMKQFGELVYTAEGHEAFVAECHQALSESRESDIVRRRIAFASQQTWKHRAEELEDALANAVRPLVSIVVLTYNNLDLTKKCLASIDACTADVRHEIVIVDNASSDGSPDYLRAYANGRSDVKLLLSDENTGFAAGNNLGLAAASGEYLVILNNDTVVTPGWASGLVRHLRADESIGLIGPVTNNIGNEAKISITYDSTEEMPALARKYTVAQMGRTFDIHTAAFFCVMIPRTVYEKVGGLDEAFGLGFFEDDDYCRRLQQENLRCVCAEDVFVHHHLSASFNKLGDERRKALMEKNRAIYEAKWGPWVPHRYRQ